MANAFTRFLGNAADKVGTFFNLPELGLSESLSEGATANSGSKPLAGTNAFYMPSVGQFVQNDGPADAASASTASEETGNSSSSIGIDPVTEYLNSLSAQGAAGSRGSTGGAGYAMRPQMRTIAGDPTVYNLLEPDGTRAYSDSLIKNAEASADKQRTRLVGDQQNAIATAKRSYDTQGADLNDAFTKEGQTEADYARGYDTRVANFGKNYRSGIASRQNAFGSANGFQSAQGDSEGLATDAFHTGTSNLAAEKASNENSFALARTGLDRNKANLTGNYNDYLKSLQNDVNDKTTALDHYVSEQKSNTAAEIAPLNAYNDVKDFDYKLDSYNPAQVHQTDLSGLGAATSFSALPSQQGATGPAANGFKLPAQQTDPNASYLDYQKTLKTPDPVKSYLYA